LKDYHEDEKARHDEEEVYCYQKKRLFHRKRLKALVVVRFKAFARESFQAQNFQPRFFNATSVIFCSTLEHKL
jgi:hypothetical protein